MYAPLLTRQVEIHIGILPPNPVLASNLSHVELLLILIPELSEQRVVLSVERFWHTDLENEREVICQFVFSAEKFKIVKVPRDWKIRLVIIFSNLFIISKMF